MIKVRFDVRRREIVDRLKKRLEHEAQRAHAHRASVGVHEREGAEKKNDYAGEPGKATVAEVATWLEMGTGSSEGRPFLRHWFDSNLARLKREMGDAMRAERAGDTEAVKRLSADWALEVQAWVHGDAEAFASLHPSTVRRRAAESLPASPPLFATGQLALAIRAMVDGEEAN